MHFYVGVIFFYIEIVRRAGKESRELYRLSVASRVGRRGELVRNRRMCLEGVAGFSYFL